MTLILAAIVGLYALAGFVIAPRLARNALLEDIPKFTDAVPSVGDIRVNPFLFQVEVRDFALARQGGEKFLGFRRLFVDFQLSSLWNRAYTFKRIELDTPYVNAVVARDGTLNLQALRPKAQPAAPQPKPPAGGETLPALRVGSFQLIQGSLGYEDQSRPSEFAARLEPVNFELKDFVTGIRGGLFTFSGVSKLGERLQWQGHLSVQPLESDGELRIEGLQARTIWDYLQDRLNFVIASGTIDVQSSYKFALREALELDMDVAQASITDLAVKPRDSEAEWVRVPKLSVTGVHADLGQRLAQIESISSSGLKLETWLASDGSLNLMQLVAARALHANVTVPQGPAASPPAVSIAVPAGAAAGNAVAAAPWRVELKQIDVSEASISAEDRGTQPAAKLLLAPLSLRIGGASLDLGKSVEMRIDTRINGEGSLAMTGTVTPQPMSASLDIKFSGIDMAMAQPYIAQRTSMTLRSGKLGGEGRLRVGPGAVQSADAKHGAVQRADAKHGAVQRTDAKHGAVPGADARGGIPLSFAGDIDVEALHTVDDIRHEDLVRWERLDVRGVNFQQNPDRLDIAEVLVRKPYARVIIESDETLNVKNVLKGPGGRSGEAGGTAAEAATPASQKKVRAAAAAQPATPSASASMPMAIKKVLIKDGVANFTDHSVTPNFSAAIQQLQGSVLGLSSKPGTRATIDLHGGVDAYSPVSIKGQVNLLGDELYTDLGMDFRNIELTLFNPYSGKFAGYNISKGKLTTELHYKIDRGQLDAQHHIVIEQLEFGEKTASKDAVSLPVKLAVALLKDRNGVIDLNLPVTGSLHDPSFRVAPILWTAFVHLLEKAVTAPFALLGSLFGGGPELQFIDFPAGATSLDPSQQSKLSGIVKALQERPQIKIEVPIGVVPDVDGPALIDAELAAQLREAMIPAGSRKKQASDAGPPSFEQLDPAAKLDVLTRAYQRNLGTAPRYPDSVTAGQQKPEQVSAKIEFLTAELRKHLTVDNDGLRALGQQRAETVQQALLNGTQIDPERVFLVANEKATAKDGAVRLELSLR